VSEPEKSFQCLPKYKGLFYQPQRRKGGKKHPCPDCHYCQECSPSRCNVCRGPEGRPKCKLSLQEQIALYEQTNKDT
jgi:hypothetical protein